MTSPARPTQALQQLRLLRESLAELPDRIRTGARVARQSGLLYSFTLPGVRKAVEALASGSRNPAMVFQLHAANTPDKPALLWRDRRLTFKELDDRMNRAAIGLQARGFRRNTSVVIMMHNRPEFLEVQAGASRLGAAAVSVSWRSTAAELVYLANHCGAKALVFQADLWPVVEEAKKSLPGIAPRDFIAVGGDVPGCGSYEGDFLSAPRSELSVDKGVEDEAAS